MHAVTQTLRVLVVGFLNSPHVTEWVKAVAATGTALAVSALAAASFLATDFKRRFHPRCDAGRARKRGAEWRARSSKAV